jgi:hypothetical protein
VLSKTTTGIGTIVWLLWLQFCKYIVPAFSEPAVETSESLQPQPPQFCRYIALALSDASAETGLDLALIADRRQRKAIAKKVNNICDFIFPPSR